jgi:hypothetical protein
MRQEGETTVRGNAAAVIAAAREPQFTAKKFRLCQWLNTKEMKRQFGIQGYVNGHWLHCSENGKPLLFDKKAEARAKLHDLESGDYEGTLKLPKVG